MSGVISLSRFWNRTGFRMSRQNTIRASTEGSVSPPLSIIFAFEAGSPASLAQKRDELRAKGVETTDIVDHGWAQSIYFKDPNGLSLEYCCVVGRFAEEDGTMQGRFTIPRSVLDVNNTLGGKMPAACSTGSTSRA
jgi:catechol-2,3-dioxygenase